MYTVRSVPKRFKRKESLPRPLDLNRGTLPGSGGGRRADEYDDSEGARGPSERTVVTTMSVVNDPMHQYASRSTRIHSSTALVALLRSRGTPANISSSGRMSVEGWYLGLASLSSICIDTNEQRKSRSDPCNRSP